MQSRFAAQRSLPLVGLGADRKLAAQKRKETRRRTAPPGSFFNEKMLHQPVSGECAVFLLRPQTVKQ